MKAPERPTVASMVTVKRGDFDQKSIIILSHYWKDVFYQTTSRSSNNIGMVYHTEKY